MNRENGFEDVRFARGLRLFLDSADPAEWSRLLTLGYFHGVTTNPVLLERAGQACTLDNLQELAQRAQQFGAREIQMQTWGADVQEMVTTGNRLADLERPGMRVVIKIPATAEGFQAAGILRQKDRAVTMTAVFTAGQVMAAASLGACYAAPYLGRLDDEGLDGTAKVLTMQEILTRTGSRTRLLTASLRKVEQVVDLAARGLDTFTCGPRVAVDLIASSLTRRAAGDFQRAAEAMAKKAPKL